MARAMQTMKYAGQPKAPARIPAGLANSTRAAAERLLSRANWVAVLLRSQQRWIMAR